ncbi:MAG: hypothetical protein ACI87E_005128 [Mariniblastus sp.]|jgi:hypothetical protein
MLAVDERISNLYQREGISIDTLSTERKATNPPVYAAGYQYSHSLERMQIPGSEEEPSLVACRQRAFAHAYRRSAFGAVAGRLIVKRFIVSHLGSTALWALRSAIVSCYSIAR